MAKLSEAKKYNIRLSLLILLPIISGVIALFSANIYAGDKIFDIKEFVTTEIIQNPPIGDRSVERWKLSNECNFTNNDTSIYAFSFIPIPDVDISSYGQLVILKNNNLVRKYEGFSFSPTSDCFKSLIIEKQTFILYNSYDSSEKKSFLRVLDANGVIRDTIEIGSRNEFRFVDDIDHKLLKISGYGICNSHIECFLKNAHDKKAVENIEEKLEVRSLAPNMGLGRAGVFRVFKIGIDGKFHDDNDQLEFIKEAENAIVSSKH